MTKTGRFTWVQILLSVVTFGIYAVVSAIVELRSSDPPVHRGEHIKCRGCGSRYIFEC